MRIIMTHGYMLSGTGSNIYVQSLCRALVGERHVVHLLCQEPDPLAYDFVGKSAKVDARGIEDLGDQEIPYPGLCVVYRPDIGDLLPVYVYDDYPGWRVKTFLDLTEEELDNYLRRNVEALKTLLGATDAEAVITNHSVPGPLIARRALEGDDLPYVSIVHGSCLQYVSRKSEMYMGLTREGLEDAREILALSSHSAGTIAEDLPDLAGKTHSLPGGVDTELFHPDAFDRGVLDHLEGGLGRGQAQRTSLREALESSGHAGELASALRAVAASYDARSHDKDAGERLRGFLDRDGPLLVYVGKLIHSKGVHSLISAFSRVRKETGARLLVIGFGTFREGLEALTYSLSAGDETTVERLAEMGKLLEGGPAGPLEHFELAEELLVDAEGMQDDVLFVGPLYHGDLIKVLPAADAAAVPSIFPETFGLVAAEFAASGVVPFVSDHSGLREAGEIVGLSLPFDLRVGMDGFEENLALALNDYLTLPEEERRRCEEVVRRNCVEHLSWGTLAEKLVALVDQRVDIEHILRDLGLILGAGLVSQLIATIIKIPQMVVLVAAGALIGPSVLGLVSNPLSGVGAQLLFNIGVALILFHGGTGISLQVISRTAVGLGLLVLPGVLLTALIVALVVSPVFGVGFPVALLVGAVLAATDPAILIPLFDRLKLRPKVSQTVIAESAFNDVTSTVLTLTLVGAVEAGRLTFSGPALEFTKELVLGALIGVVSGVVLCYALSSTVRAGIWDESPGVAIFAVVALAYFSTESLGGSAYLATFVMGLMVGNMELLRLGHHDEHATLLEGFLGQVAEIATLLIFITLGLNLPFEALGKYFLGGLLVMFVFIFVARPITVLACLLPDRRGGWTGREMAFISWCRETGVIPAAVASLLLSRGVEGAEIAVSMVALAVCTTLLLQATTAGYVARRLDLLDS